MEGPKKRRPAQPPDSGELGMEPMSTGQVQKRNAFAACIVSRIEGLEVSLDRARDIAVREELEGVERHIQEAQRYLSQIRVLHQEALDEFSRAQGE
jgi:hypothetical protein